MVGSVRYLDFRRQRDPTLESFDNQAFSRGTSISSRKGIIDDNRLQNETIEEEANIDGDSFRSDLERDSTHSSMADRPQFQQMGNAAFRRLSHEQRYEELQRQSISRASMEHPRRPQQPPPSHPRYPILDTSQIQIRLDYAQELQEKKGKKPRSAAAPRPTQRPPPPPGRRPTRKRSSKPEPKLSNLFGVVDTRKLRSLLYNDDDDCYLPSDGSLKLHPIPEASAPPREESDPPQPQRVTSASPESRTAEENPYKTHNALFYGSVASFVAGILLLMSFASPYWLQSWEDTQSPFKNMGLWEFCFYKFRHPDYQFDHLFHGCHALYGDEYRLIREKLLPGWLMVVQLFVTLALIASYLGQGVIVCLLLRTPLEWILRFEWHFCGIALVCKGLSAVLLFLSICIFGGECWDRDWLYYPNYNYVSWSYAFAVFSCLGHVIATAFMFIDCQQAKERKEKNKALIMQMHPPAFASTVSSYHMGGSGYI